MNVHELPLIAFTILAQMCVGAFVVLGLIQVLGPRFVSDDADLEAQAAQHDEQSNAPVGS